MKKRVVGVLGCVLLMLSTGCSDECVDQFDCRREKGDPAEGQEWFCNSDEKCEQRPIVELPLEPDAGDADAGVPDSGTPDAGEPDAGVDGGGQGTGGKGDACTTSADCTSSLRCEGAPSTCQAMWVAVTGRDDGGTSKALVMRFDTPGITALTEGSADSRYPRWSPGGTHVSFVQGAVDSSGKKVAGELTVRDVPLVAGQSVVVADGGSGDTESFRSMEWEPGAAIAYVRQNASQRSGISTVAPGTSVSQVTTTGAFPDWSRDGSTLAYNVTEEGLLTVKPGGSPSPVANADKSSEQPHYNRANEQLLYLANPAGELETFEGESLPTSLFRLYNIDVTGGGQPQLVADVTTESSTGGDVKSFIAAPTWAPDGSWAAYVRAYYFKPTSGKPVLCGSLVSPCQSRPGNVIFLKRINPADGSASGDEVRVADDGTLPSFSPDGRYIAFIKGGQLQIQQLDPAAGTLVNAPIVHPKAGFTLQTGDSDDHRPRWQPR
ncbi:hypothetical protein NVS55_11470 [Myxococcus stipitatus]|uniref:TolB family protein n=1 Tax=Myxococcus stipitatus TaxID=83455 RepID=UPI003145023E